MDKSATLKKTVVLGVIGVDAHVVGNKIIAQALRDANFNVVNLGTFVPAEEFIKAAIETNAEAILIGSLCGHGELDCQGFREKCVEAGKGNIHVVIGGNLVIGKQDWESVHERFLKMGFNRAYPPGVPIWTIVSDLEKDLGVADED